MSAYKRTVYENRIEEQWTLNGMLHQDNDLPAWIVYDLDGRASIERYYEFGLLHRSYGPAIVQYYDKSDKIYTEGWWNCGKNVRLTGSGKISKKPTNITYNNLYKPCSCIWLNADGEIHNDNGPAHIIYDRAGLIEQEMYYLNGVPKRDNLSKPVVNIYKNGILRVQQWGHDSDCIDMPTFVTYDEEGRLKLMVWYDEHAQFHRDKLPAYIEFNEEGKCKEIAFWYHGLCTQKQFDVDYTLEDSTKEFLKTIYDEEFNKAEYY